MTGQCACDATWETVDPRMAEEIAPCPRDPITTMTAVRLCSTRVAVTEPAVDTVSTGTPACSTTAAASASSAGPSWGSVMASTGVPDIVAAAPSHAAGSGSQ